MKRKALIISIIAIIISLFSISYTFAANGKMDNVANGIRNFVGGAENVIEDAGSAVGNTVRDGMNTIGNGAKDVENAGENVVGAATDNRDNNGYTATRTSGTTDGNDGAGVSSNMYVWWIVGITAVGIIVLLWAYFREKSQSNMYIDSNDR